MRRSECGSRAVRRTHSLQGQADQLAPGPQNTVAAKLLRMDAAGQTDGMGALCPDIPAKPDRQRIAGCAFQKPKIRNLLAGRPTRWSPNGEGRDRRHLRPGADPSSVGDVGLAIQGLCASGSTPPPGQQKAPSWRGLCRLGGGVLNPF